MTDFFVNMLDFLERVFSPLAPACPLLFTQFYFWAFFALIYAVFALVCRKPALRNLWLLAVSLFFYFRVGGAFVLLLAAVTCSDYLLARLMGRSGQPWLRKLFVVLSVGIDISILCYFKYTGFVLAMLSDVTGGFHVDDIIAPLGISFYLFRNISYTVDVYRGKVEPVKNFIDFALYVSFFPSLVSGPITRASDFIPQLHRPFSLPRKYFGLAIFWILNGLAKKVILSDYLAANFIDRVFDNPLLFSGFENLSAIVGYTLQLYADFSGYTDVAIGLAILMGFYLPKNFDSPYKADSPQNFWKRWHISLSSWLQHYLYIPLGGNRRVSFGTFFFIIAIPAALAWLSGSVVFGAILVAIAALIALEALIFPGRRKAIASNLNTMVTMLLGGLWHGASWNFLIWGGLNGLGIAAGKNWKSMSWGWRMAIVTFITEAVVFLWIYARNPYINILFVWCLLLFVVTSIRYLYHVFGGKREFAALGHFWAVFQTFVFIMLTWMFFRAGTGADPADAGASLDTVKNMLGQIGGQWTFKVVPDVLASFWKVYVIIVAGLMIHWLPDKAKRWYRLNFAMLPLPVIGLVVVVAVFLLYQFMSAGVHPFIYFQF